MVIVQCSIVSLFCAVALTWGSPRAVARSAVPEDVTPQPAAAPVPAPPRAADEEEDAAAEETIVERLAREATALRPLVDTALAERFLDGVARLPEPAARTVYRDAEKRWLSARAAAALDDEARAALDVAELSADRFYDTKYGSPLAYVRVVELLGEHGVDELDGERVLDFGYGSVGQLRLLADMGADAHGVDVDTFLTALYSEPGDVGAVGDGAVTLHEGAWPADAEVRDAIGGGYRVFTSKNTLKRGYIHPEREADPRMLVHLGVDDAAFLTELGRLLEPGGLVVIYNLSPAQAPPDEPYIPWADGRCPFSRESWEAAGFEVLAFDVDDRAWAHRMGAALGWGESMDFERDLFAHYTVARRREG